MLAERLAPHGRASHAVTLESAAPSGHADPHIALEHVGLTYLTTRGPLTALQDVNCNVRPAEFVSVLGPSGCGKSTMLRLICGLMKPSEGSIKISGSPVLSARRDVGVVFQQPTLLPWKTVQSNVLMPLDTMRLRSASADARAKTLLKMVGLEEFGSHYPWELSGGMQQRVAIARSLVHEPTALLMDEPFAALDAMTRELMMEELQRIWLGTGKSVLFITHNIVEAVFLSDRVYVMSARPGRIAEEVRVDLPRPRTIQSMADARFVDLSQYLRETVRRMTRNP